MGACAGLVMELRIPFRGSALVRAAGLVMALTLLSRVTGFLREAALAAGFGATPAADAYLLAFTVPNLIAAVLGGAASRALLPRFTALNAGHRPAAAWRLASAAFNGILLVTAVISLAGIIGAVPLVRLLAPGFTGETLSQAVAAVKVLMPASMFYCGGLIVTSVMQSLRRFTLPAAIPIAQNLVMAAGALLLAGSGPQALAWVTLSAVALDIVVPGLGLRPWWQRYQAVVTAPDLRRMALLMLPLMAAALVNQVVTAVDWAVASRTGAGHIAALAFADRLRQLPLGLFAATATTVLYPELADLAARGAIQRFRRQLLRGLAVVLAVTLPAAVAMAVFRAPLVAIAFQRGAFRADAAAATGAALLWMAPGLVGVAAGALLSVAFYAREDTRTPFLIQGGAAVVNIILDVVLAKRYGHVGIAMAGSTAAIISAITYGLVLSWRWRRQGPATAFVAARPPQVDAKGRADSETE